MSDMKAKQSTHMYYHSHYDEIEFVYVTLFTLGCTEKLKSYLNENETLILNNSITAKSQTGVGHFICGHNAGNSPV